MQGKSENMDNAVKYNKPHFLLSTIFLYRSCRNFTKWYSSNSFL